MKVISSFRFAELPPFSEKATSCRACGGMKFRMKTSQLVVGRRGHERRKIDLAGRKMEVRG